MTNKKIRKLNLGFEIGDTVTVDNKGLYYSYSQFVKRHPKFAPRWQYKCFINEDGMPLRVVGVYKHVMVDPFDSCNYCVVVKDRYGRIYLVGENGVKKVEKVTNQEKNVAIPITNKRETRIYKIEGLHRQLNELEQIFSFIEYLGVIGHSSGFRVFVDGDGAARLRFTDADGNDLMDVNSNRDKIKSRMDKNFGLCDPAQ